MTTQSKGSTFSKYAKKRHKSACRMLGFALTEDTRQGWHDLGAIFAVRLSVEERMAIAGASIVTLPPDAIDAVCTALENHGRRA